jgi:hypothetical protein
MTSGALYCLVLIRLEWCSWSQVAFKLTIVYPSKINDFDLNASWNVVFFVKLGILKVGILLEAAFAFLKFIGDLAFAF